mmetsp:Transcript_23501/g.48908  ORF Transcript_23501/g.48908 Transcript_23501/m.48908 type:complete len:221 (-) Transcript_23501:87-749(-)
MTLSAQVPATSPYFVLEGVLMLPVVSLAHDTAKRQTCPREFLSKANVKGDVGVVRVHVQAKVFALLVANNESVVIIKRTNLGPLPVSDLCQNVILQDIHHGPPPDFIQDDAVVVHAVGASYRKSRRRKMVYLFNQHLAKCWGEDLAGKHGPWQVLSYHACPSIICVCPECKKKVLVEPLCLPAGLDVKEFRMLLQGLVVTSHAGLLLREALHSGALDGRT